MQTDEAITKRHPRWTNGTVPGIGLASPLAYWSHEIVTTMMPAGGWRRTIAR